jgi:hypothetical protein
MTRFLAAPILTAERPLIGAFVTKATWISRQVLARIAPFT